jgi:hypothetical protein
MRTMIVNQVQTYKWIEGVEERIATNNLVEICYHTAQRDMLRACNYTAMRISLLCLTTQLRINVHWHMTSKNSSILPRWAGGVQLRAARLQPCRWAADLTFGVARPSRTLLPLH